MTSTEWTNVYKENDLLPEAGLCALFKSEQVAIFKLAFNNLLYAVSNYDPFSEANVISRGIMGSLGDRVVVSSPVFKQHFCLETGECLESDASLKTYAIRSHKGNIQIKDND